MQNKILLLLVISCMCYAASAQTSFKTISSANVKSAEKETSFYVSVVPDATSPAFRLYVYNPGQKKIELQISHALNGVVVDTSFNVDQFSCRYNFESTDDGNYLITLTRGKEKVSKTVGINTVTARNVIVIE